MSESSPPIRSVHTTMLAIRLGTDLYAIPLEAVEEVLPALPVEAVPLCPAFVRGVVYVRGRLIPVVDAAERLGLKQHERPDEPPIVCIRVDGRLAGVEVDEAIDLMDLASEHVFAADDLGLREGLLSGLVEKDGRTIRILDPAKLVAREVWSACA